MTYVGDQTRLSSHSAKCGIMQVMMLLYALQYMSYKLRICVTQVSKGQVQTNFYCSDVLFLKTQRNASFPSSLSLLH